MKKFLKIVAVILLVGFTFLFVKYHSSITIISGFAAKSACSCAFIANRPLEEINAGDNDISMVNLATSKIDYEEKSVTSSVYGLKKRKAIYREGVGCVLLPVDETFNEKEMAAKPNRSDQSSMEPFPFGNGEPVDTIFKEVNYELLDKAINSAFDESGQKVKRTRALLVVYKGHLIAEKYGEGITKETPLIGWSMTKSITSTIVGVMEKEGRVQLEQDNLFSEWENDERKEITLNNLLQMNSGLEWDENYDRMSDATNMLYVNTDMSQLQLEKPQVGEPDETWNYSSGISNVIAKLIRNQFNSHQDYLDYWYSSFIDKIGMHSMVLETDCAGNYVGSSYSWATGRDWAKMGMLYLNKGHWNGEQIFNEFWADYVQKPTKTSSGDYGGHFWLNSGGKMPDVPRNVYSMNGYQGQRVFIYPTQNLVVVRLGLTDSSKFDFNGLLTGIQEAMKISQ